jgi:S1/P1 Nuclease
MTWQSNWHFKDTPYLDQGGSVDDYPNFKPDPNTVDLAIGDIMNWLTAKGDYTNSFVYHTIMSNNVGTEDEAKSFALRLLIHYIGDVHQPLHATARLDPKYPKGDAGGNFFHLPEKLGAKNLHSVWDSIVYLWTGTPKLPLSYNDWTTQGQAVADLEKKYSFNPADW